MGVRQDAIRLPGGRRIAFPSALGLATEYSLGEGQGRHVVYLASLGHNCTGLIARRPGQNERLATERGVSDKITVVNCDLSEFRRSRR